MAVIADVSGGPKCPTRHQPQHPPPTPLPESPAPQHQTTPTAPPQHPVPQPPDGPTHPGRRPTPPPTPTPQPPPETAHARTGPAASPHPPDPTPETPDSGPQCTPDTSICCTDRTNPAAASDDTDGKTRHSTTEPLFLFFSAGRVLTGGTGVRVQTASTFNPPPGAVPISGAPSNLTPACTQGIPPLGVEGHVTPARSCRRPGAGYATGDDPGGSAGRRQAVHPLGASCQ